MVLIFIGGMISGIISLWTLSKYKRTMDAESPPRSSRLISVLIRIKAYVQTWCRKNQTKSSSGKNASPHAKSHSSFKRLWMLSLRMIFLIYSCLTIQLNENSCKAEEIGNMHIKMVSSKPLGPNRISLKCVWFKTIFLLYVNSVQKEIN